MKSSSLSLLTNPNGSSQIPSFVEALSRHGLPPLRAKILTTLQVNVGKLCNQTCQHCHVDAGPQRTEIMTKDTMDHVLRVLAATPSITTVDITGGAPEMNPHFEYLVEECRKLEKRVLDRCNLTVFFVKGKGHLPRFLANHRVEIIASLPCYQQNTVDEQRGKGVFDRSISALQQLNTLGYGENETGLILNLVYNPLGPSLPAPQGLLEKDYKEELGKRYGIRFNNLFTITNMPINRFLTFLEENGKTEEYYTLLVNSFNPAAVEGLMCRSLLSVGWDGRLYDCDFNQMLNVPLIRQNPGWITEFSFDALRGRDIATGSHCFGCTAGSGSSCGGVLI